MRNGVGRKDGGFRQRQERVCSLQNTAGCSVRKESRVHSGRGQQEEALKAGGAERAWLKSEVIWKQEVPRGQLTMTFAYRMTVVVWKKIKPSSQTYNKQNSEDLNQPIKGL